MPTSYRYFSCADLPRLEPGESITHQAQASIPGFDHEAHSTLTLARRSDHGDFLRFECVHQEQRNVDAIFEQREVRQAIFNERFEAFYNSEKLYFLVRNDRKKSKSFFDRLSRARPVPVEATPGALDLQEVMRLGQTTGGWFANVRLSGVQSAGLFGHDDIGTSDEWARYSAESDMSAVYVRVESRAGSVLPVMITRDRAVIVQKDVGERENLDLVAHLNDAFVQLGCVLDG
jgi:hypothetical protein